MSGFSILLLIVGLIAVWTIFYRILLFYFWNKQEKLIYKEVDQLGGRNIKIGLEIYYIELFTRTYKVLFENDFNEKFQFFCRCYRLSTKLHWMKSRDNIHWIDFDTVPHLIEYLSDDFDKSINNG